MPVATVSVTLSFASKRLSSTGVTVIVTDVTPIASVSCWPFADNVPAGAETV